MLVLTRKQGEQIRIGDDVVITVVRTKGKGVRLGIQAPAHVPVLRAEVARAMTDSENRQACDGTGDGAAADWSISGELDADGDDVLGARGGRGLLRQMVASRGA
jgi:carbon storage regulator